MKLIEKMTSGVLACAVALGAVCFPSAAPSAAAATDAVALVERMGMGWNLGNTFDCAPVKAWVSTDPYVDTEVGWGNPTTTKAMIAAIKNAGFSTVRIPVTWFENMDSAGNVDEDYLARVKEVVDYCIDQDMYAIINVHHDGASQANGNSATSGATSSTINGAWLWQGTSQMSKFKTLWTQIANYFKSYDEHLAFAGWNEISLSYGDELIFAETFVDAVRKTGGSNANRLLIIPANNTNLEASLSGSFMMPDDEMTAVEIHYYAPPAFSIAEANVSWCTPATTWGTAAEVAAMKNDINSLYQKFAAKGTPVIIGECGVLTNEGKDKEDIRDWLQTLFSASLGFDGICPILWDSSDCGDMQYFSRKNMKWNDSAIETMFKNMSGSETNTTTTYTFDASKYKDAEDWEYYFDLKPFKGVGNIVGFNIQAHGTSTGKDSCFGIAVQFNGYYTEQETGKADDYHWLVSQISYGYNMESYAFMLDTTVMSDGENDIGTEGDGYHLSYDYLKLNSWWDNNCSDYAVDYVTLMFDAPIVLDDTGAVITSASAESTTTTTTTTTTTSSTTPETTTSTTLSSAETTTSGKDAAVVWGDADCNGAFEMTDCVRLAKATVGVAGGELTAEGKANCDLYADGNISSNDMGVALKLMAGIYNNAQMPIQP